MRYHFTHFFIIRILFYPLLHPSNTTLNLSTKTITKPSRPFPHHLYSQFSHLLQKLSTPFFLHPSHTLYVYMGGNMVGVAMGKSGSCCLKVVRFSTSIVLYSML